VECASAEVARGIVPEKRRMRKRSKGNKSGKEERRRIFGHTQGKLKGGGNKVVQRFDIEQTTRETAAAKSHPESRREGQAQQTDEGSTKRGEEESG